MGKVRPYGRPDPNSPTGARALKYGKALKSHGVVPVLDYDLTTQAGLAASGVTAAWTGPNMLPMISAATAASVAQNLPVWESRFGSSDGGLYVWDAFTALVALPNNFLTSWTHVGSPTYNADFSIAPDGTLTADRIRDASGVAAVNINRSRVNSLGLQRIWVRAVAGDVPGVAPIFAIDTTGTTFTSLGLSTTWHNVILKHTIASTHIAVIFDLASQGAIELWGCQKTGTNNSDRRHTLPTASNANAVGMCTIQIPLADVNKLIDGSGNYDFELRFLPTASSAEYSAGLQDNCGIVYIPTTAGSIYIRWSRTIPSNVEGMSYWLVVNGVDVASTGRVVTSVVRGNVLWQEDFEESIRVYITPTSVRFRPRSNCCLADDTEVTGLSLTLGTPTGCYLGSQNTVALSSLKARLTRFRAWADHSEMATNEPVSMLLFGDSTMAYIGTGVGAGPCVGTVAEARAGKRLHSIAAGGDVLNGQIAKLNSSPYKTNPALAAKITSAFIQLPINDINSALGSVDVAQMTSQSQTLVDTLAAAFPGIKVFWLAPLPADAVLDATDRQQWIDYISCLNGVPAGGGSVVTGLTEFILTASNAMNSNGSVGAPGTNLLSATYDSGDGLHEKDIGYQLIGSTINARAVANGVW